MKKRILAFDGLRGLAALCVVLFHFTIQYDRLYQHQTPYLAFEVGRHAVLFFFILSGYMMFQTLCAMPSAKTFLIRRFWRLYPVYWACLWVTTLVVSHWGLPNRETTAVETRFNYTMLQDFYLVRPVDGAHWTLSIELMVYGAVFIILLCRATRWLPVIFYGLLGVGIGLSSAELTALPYVLQLGLPYFHLFILGYVLAAHHEATWSRVTTVSLGLLCLLWQLQYHELETSLFALFSMGVVIFAQRTSCRFLEHPLLLRLGAISYTLYLVHQNVGYVIIRQLEQRHVSSMASILIATVGVVGLAAVITTIVDDGVRVFRTCIKKGGISNDKI